MLRLLWLLLLAAPLWAGDAFDRVRSFIRKELAEQKIPSIAVAVARDGKIVWEEGFGWADRENRAAATEHTMYSLASISKPITATGLMVLRERGLVDLDRPANDYLGEAKIRARVGDAAQATVRRVANHSAGLPLHYHFFYADEPRRPPPMDETIRRYANLLTPPGERYHYSNLGYGLIDYVISRVSGISYADFMRQEVFEPLGLTRTSVDIGAGLEKHHAIRYASDGTPLPFYDFDHAGGSAVYASAHDLVRFGLFHLKAHLADQKAILPDAAIDEMHRPTVESGKGAGYGVGWATSDTRGPHRIVSHSGGMGGVTTLLELVPAQKLAVVVLANANTDLVGRVRQEIFSVALPAAARGNAASAESPAAFQPPPALAGTWKGSVHTYSGEVPLTLWLSSSGVVEARLGEQPQTLVNGVSFRDGFLAGRMTGELATEDARRRPHSLALSLKLRGDVLNGAVSALSRPGPRPGFALTHWAELRKQ